MFTSGINKIENLREKSGKIKELHLRQSLQRRINKIKYSNILQDVRISLK